MAIRFIQRNGLGAIMADFAALQPGIAEETIDEAAPEFVAYKNPPPDPRRVLDADEAAAAKLDAQVVQFLNMTPVELDAWVDANITGAGPRTAFKVLGRLAQHAARGRTLR